MSSDILIIGAGPAGLAAATAAADAGLQIDIIDDNFMSGGQIWRGGAQQQRDPRALAMWQKLTNNNHVRFHFQSKVVHASKKNAEYEFIVETQAASQAGTQSHILTAKKIILCTGARELLLPFPGWTLPGVTGAGGLQALAKAGYPVAGKRIIVAGTGPLLLAVAASLIERGAQVTHILEQTTFSQLGKFGLGLLATPSKITQAIGLWRSLRSVAYHSNSYVEAAVGNDKINGVRVNIQGEQRELPCDLLACGYGLIPNIDIAAALGCELEHDANSETDYACVKVNEWQMTSLDGIYCAGEGTGVGGVDLALAEGSIAGYAASNQTIQNIPAEHCFGERDSWKNFAQRLHRHFALRKELRQLAQADTIVCRCEDVSFSQLQQYRDWRDAKLHTRCGMGACQGRICGAANRFLFSWEKDVGRLPLSSAKISSLLVLNAEQQTPAD
ncbi:FAD-dependent oxidoreductase [Undibacterium sp. Ji22W]|uniref:FAD-dependent oxidoreductase n=1 Tax=Undibacterium sp. Ji22W TaxID=3413038 RepID=UPI003BF19EB6